MFLVLKELANVHKAQIYFIVCSRLLWRVVFFNLCTSQHVTWKHIDYWFFISFIQYSVPNHVPIMNMICSIFLKKSFLSKIIDKARVGGRREDLLSIQALNQDNERHHFDFGHDNNSELLSCWPMGYTSSSESSSAR